MEISLIPGIETSASAIDSERMRLNTIANNIANANTTHDVDGKAYRRKLVVFETVLDQAKQGMSGSSGDFSGTPVRVSKVVDDPSPLKSVYMPSHPDADEGGMVQMPNVNVAEEMVDMITASRSIEANLQVITTAKQMVQRALDIGRH